MALNHQMVLRQDMDKILEEIKLAGNEGYQKVGADYLIIESVTAFGRNNINKNYM